MSDPKENTNVNRALERPSQIRYLYAAALLAMLLLGGIWFVGNAPHVPAYGDTTEYLTLSKTLAVDQYRTVFYPAILRLCGVAKDDVSTPSVLCIYLVQVFTSLAATGIYATAVFKSLSISNPSTRLRIYVPLLTTVLLATNPLVAHFSLSIMSDSLASSLTVATVGALTHLTSRDRSSSSPRLQWGWLWASSACLFLMALSRVDKLYLGLALASAAVFYVCFTLPGVTRVHRLAVTLSLATSLASATAINRETQVRSADRPALDLSNMAFNRVVWPRLAKVYIYLPQDAKRLINPEEARWFDEHNNHVYLFLDQILGHHPENQQIISDITRTTLEQYPWQVVGKTLFDTAKYTLPNLAFPLELASILPESVATDWTYSRMSGPHPAATMALTLTSILAFYLLQLPIALVGLQKHGFRAWRRHPVVWFTLVAIGCNAVMFGLESGMDAHIRYALPTFTMILTLVVVTSLLWLFGRADSHP